MNPILPPFSHSCLTLLSIMLPFNRSWIHQLDWGRVTVRRSSGTITPYLVAQRCRTVLKGGTYGDFSSPESTATNYPVSRTRRLAHETSLEDSFVSRTRRSAHETTSADPFVSRTRRSAHEATSEDPPVSRMRLFAHEATSEDPSVSRTRRLAHETTSEDSSVSRMRRLAHETTLEDPPVSRMRRSAHETTSELSCATGTLRELYGRSSMPPR